MSAIVAVSRNGQHALGADSGSWRENFQMRLSVPKVWEHGDALIGLCGDAGKNHAVYFGCGAGTIPTRDDGESAPLYVMNRLVPAMRDAMNATAPDDNAAFTEMSGIVLCGGYGFSLSSGRAYTILQPGDDGYLVAGAPSDFMLGALATFSALDPDEDPVKAVRGVLFLAVEHTDAALAPIVVLTAAS